MKEIAEHADTSGICIENQELKLCSFVEELCTCDGKPPFLFYSEENKETQACPCATYRNRLAQTKKILKEANIPLRYYLQQFPHFKETAKNKFALSQAKNLVKNLKTEKKGIYFLGQPGSGKTMLGNIILTEIMLRYAIPTRYLKINRDFFNRLRETYNPKSKNYGEADDIAKQFSEVSVLLLDDFGVQADSEWEKRTLYDLIDARWENRLLTIITSNKNPNEFKELFDGRIYSRLAGMTTVVVLTGKDYRLPEKLKF